MKKITTTEFLWAGKVAFEKMFAICYVHLLKPILGVVHSNVSLASRFPSKNIYKNNFKGCEWHLDINKHCDLDCG